MATYSGACLLAAYVGRYLVGLPGQYVPNPVHEHGRDDNTDWERAVDLFTRFVADLPMRRQLKTFYDMRACAAVEMPEAGALSEAEVHVIFNQFASHVFSPLALTPCSPSKH